MDDISYKEYKEEEMRATAREVHQSAMESEFEGTMTDMDIAKAMIDNGDEEMTFEDMERILLEEYMSLRDESW